MIFTTVGTQLSFDRLLRIVDEWAKENNHKVFCQTANFEIKLKHVEHKTFVTPSEFDNLMKECQIIVAHAGIGSILSAMKYKKPIIIFPRKASLGEHRNEHQLATAKQFSKKPGIYVAYDDIELLSLLNNYSSLTTGNQISSYASDELITTIKNFINS
jgi:UDP-N-acetylglucosamine transferase subunit ALG13